MGKWSSALTREELHCFLDEKAAQYENINFLEEDPIQIPHLYAQPIDVEISGFLTAIIAWGQRKTIIANAHKLMSYLDNAPGDFILGATDQDFDALGPFVHRTFQHEDLVFFLKRLHQLYSQGKGLSSFFDTPDSDGRIQESISRFKHYFFSVDHPLRSQKHLPDPLKGAAAKRMNMYLRWMVRSPRNGVDFGIWSLPSSALSCPLDVHTARVARKLGLIHRKLDDAKTLQELDTQLRQMDPVDPAKYDFALFGLGVFEKF